MAGHIYININFTSIHISPSLKAAHSVGRYVYRYVYRYVCITQYHVDGFGSLLVIHRPYLFDWAENAS